ncbi:MAG: adenylate/guanylate cyclase domain-containing protein, partial [Bacteroidota bacterium]
VLLNSENDLQEAQIQRASILRNFLFVASGLLLIIIAGIYYQYRFAKRSNKIISDERNRSDQILLNILPEDTVAELKANGSVKAKKFDQVSVLFTDFKEFTKVAEVNTPEALVNSIDYYFRNFDDIISRHGLEKIKTIGDAYMCAGGLPKPNSTHATDAIAAAIDLVSFVNLTKQNPPKGILPFDIRIGISTGPVVAGVVGTKKFQYDIWGRTVNTASRMESSSTAGRINISASTYQMASHRYNCEYRGEVVAKHGEVLKMYFVETPVLIEQ